MKKSSFITLVLGTISCVFFSLGMCMALIPRWNSFRQGVIFGCVGIILGIITVIVWRKLEHKAPIKISGKNVLIIFTGITGALLLGVGMCYCMVWNNIVKGVVTGLAGIVFLLALIPLIKGFKD